MKKSLILVGMLAIGYANAQEGKVGINTDTPQATLEVLPTKKNLEGTTNEGIVAPKLTKARIANIADANLVEGTLVYATDTTYTGNNAKVAKITEKGYYFYNGTEWVKTSAGDTNTSIYTNDGAFTSDRLATMNEKNLIFMGRNDHNVMISKDGRIKIGTGTTMPGSALTIDGTGGANDDISINTYNNTPNNNSAFSFYSNKYNGTIENKQPVVAGNHLGNFNFRAYNGTSLVNGVVINAVVSEVDGTNVRTNLILSPTKNVGISTDDPLAKLDVAGNIRVQTPGERWESIKTGTGGITSSTKLTNSYHSFLRQETQNGHFASIGGIRDVFGIFAITAEQTENATTGQLVMNTATGNVAIGQPFPDANAKLTVVGGIRAAKGDTTGDISNVGYAFEKDGDTGMFAVGGEGTVLGSNLVLKQNNQNAIVILHNNRNVGIGTDNPTHKLEVAGNTLTNGGFFASYSNNTGGWLELSNPLKTEGKEVNRWRLYNMTHKDAGGVAKYTNGLHFWAYAADGTNLSSQMVLTDEGNLGIGFPSNPTASKQTQEKLEVNGNIRATGLEGTGNRNVYVDAAGVLRAGDTTSSGATTLTGETGLVCNATNRGKMNFIPREKGGDVFGICMKNDDGNYYWGYMVGGNNPTNGEGAFGSGL